MHLFVHLPSLFYMISNSCLAGGGGGGGMVITVHYLLVLRTRNSKSLYQSNVCN